MKNKRKEGGRRILQEKKYYDTNKTEGKREIKRRWTDGMKMTTKCGMRRKEQNKLRN